MTEIVLRAQLKLYTDFRVHYLAHVLHVMYAAARRCKKSNASSFWSPIQIRTQSKENYN